LATSAGHLRDALCDMTATAIKGPRLPPDGWCSVLRLGFLDAGSGACVTDSSRVRRYRNAFARCRRVHRAGNPAGSWVALDLFIAIPAVPLPAGSGIGVPGVVVATAIGVTAFLLALVT
jgi:hypothetical protein